MAKIIDKALLNVGTELVLDLANRTYQLVEIGNLIAKDGVTFQALYSKFVSLWTNPLYNEYPFPLYAIDAKSGQFEIGTDGQNYNLWKPLDDITRQMHRDAGWTEYNTDGTIARQYVGVVSLGNVSIGAQLYYQKEVAGLPINFTFTDECNEAIQVYGDINNGNFDTRTYFKAFTREQGKTYADSVLGDTGEIGTGAYKINMLLSNDNDTKITDLDSAMVNAPYNGITIEYFAANQQRTIGGVPYNFNIIVNGNGATLEQIYTKLQYLLRQNSDIDSGLGTVIGLTADTVAYFVASTLETGVGVYIDNIQSADSNRIRFKDITGVFRENPYTASGTITSNSVLVGVGSAYRMMYTTVAGLNNNYGEAGAVTVNDALGNPIAGVITSNSIAFDFDYDNDTAGGPAGTDKNVTVVAIRPNSSKFVVATGTLTRSKTMNISLIAETDRAYI